MDEIGQLPVLEGEIFESVKPGLSAFVDQPKQVSLFVFLIRYLDSQCLDNSTTLLLLNISCCSLLILRSYVRSVFFPLIISCVTVIVYPELTRALIERG